MRLYTLPDGTEIDLDQVDSVSPVFINKNYSAYNCYNIHMSSNIDYGVFESELSRAAFVAAWSV